MLEMFDIIDYPVCSPNPPEYIEIFYEVIYYKEYDGIEKRSSESKIIPKKISCTNCCHLRSDSIILQSNTYCDLDRSIYECSSCRKTRISPIPLSEIL